MSLTKLSLAGNNLIIPGQREFGYSDIPSGDGKTVHLFLQCTFFTFDQISIVKNLVYECFYFTTCATCFAFAKISNTGQLGKYWYSITVLTALLSLRTSRLIIKQLYTHLSM
jgi:hypothetical protein